MAWVVPHELEDAVYAATRVAVGDAALATSALTRAIIDRSLRYTSERERLATPGDKVGDLAARAAFFTIADAMKIGIPIAELANRNALPARRPLRVVDLGAGCGAMTLGLVASLDPAIALDVVALDRDAAALGIATHAIRQLVATLASGRAGAVTVTTRIGDVSQLPIPDADLVVLGTVLNELGDPTAAVALVERALAAISDDGAVIIIEPALRETTRALHEVRDAIIQRGSGHVAAPCIRHLAPCPALADPDDWCHEDRALTLPPRTHELSRLTHLRDSGMKFSYLVLRRQPLALVDAPGAWRIVGSPRPAHGKLEVIGCSDHGRLPLRLLKRNRSARTRDVERVDRGDVLVTPAAPGPDRVEIEDVATRVDPSKH